MYWGITNRDLLGKSPSYSDDLVTGGSPRYQIYPTKDGRFIAAAPIEEKFWNVFCELINLPTSLRDVGAPQNEVIETISTIFQSQTSEYWISIFDGKDVCCNLVLNLDEAMLDKHFTERKIFNSFVNDEDRVLTALPLPLSKNLSDTTFSKPYPRLGNNNSEFINKKAP
jgi:crotonobetainyl-CoA:carnitine CoA-transferase CaiB-like acyl-CoA transferase